jgi:hypothetical protein
MVTNINKIYLGYQPCQIAKNQHFRDLLCPHHHGNDDGEIITLMMGTEMVPEMLVVFNELTQLM